MTACLGRDTGGGAEGAAAAGTWPATSSGQTNWTGSRPGFPRLAVFEGPLESFESIPLIRQGGKLRLREAEWFAKVTC